MINWIRLFRYPLKTFINFKFVRKHYNELGWHPWHPSCSKTNSFRKTLSSNQHSKKLIIPISNFNNIRSGDTYIDCKQAARREKKIQINNACLMIANNCEIQLGTYSIISLPCSWSCSDDVVIRSGKSIASPSGIKCIVTCRSEYKYIITCIQVSTS